MPDAPVYAMPAPALGHKVRFSMGNDWHLAWVTKIHERTLGLHIFAAINGVMPVQHREGVAYVGDPMLQDPENRTKATKGVWDFLPDDTVRNEVKTLESLTAICQKVMDEFKVMDKKFVALNARIDALPEYVARKGKPPMTAEELSVASHGSKHAAKTLTEEQKAARAQANRDNLAKARAKHAANKANGQAQPQPEMTV